MIKEKTFTKIQLSRFSGISLREIGIRAKVLNISDIYITNIGTKIYHFTYESVGRILMYKSLKTPETVITKEIYHIYESKLNTQENE